MKLETIEDFEVVAGALKYGGRPKDYAVKEFGYCTFCGEITECHPWHMGPEGSGTDCLKCRRTFGALGKYPDHQYLRGDDIPLRLRGDLIERQSREVQKSAFVTALREFIKKEKTKAKEAKSEARKAQAAVSKANAFLADLV